MTFVQDLPLHTITLLGGVITTSYAFFMHVGLAQVGIVPLIRDQLGNSGLSPHQKLRLWGIFFKPIAVLSIGTTITGSLLNLSTAYLTPLPQVQNLTLAAGLLGPLMIPYTIFFILPTNNRLAELAKMSSLSESQQKEGLQLIAKWDRLHKRRFVGFAGCWAMAFSAFVLAGRVNGRNLD